MCAGREDREFGAKSTLKKKKTGGLSNREKDKRKRLPFAARSGQVRRAGDAAMVAALQKRAMRGCSSARPTANRPLPPPAWPCPCRSGSGWRRTSPRAPRITRATSSSRAARAHGSCPAPVACLCGGAVAWHYLWLLPLCLDFNLCNSIASQLPLWPSSAAGLLIAGRARLVWCSVPAWDGGAHVAVGQERAQPEEEAKLAPVAAHRHGE